MEAAEADLGTMYKKIDDTEMIKVITSARLRYSHRVGKLNKQKHKAENSLDVSLTGGSSLKPE